MEAFECEVIQAIPEWDAGAGDLLFRSRDGALMIAYAVAGDDPLVVSLIASGALKPASPASSASVAAFVRRVVSASLSVIRRQLTPSRPHPAWQDRAPRLMR